MRNPDDTKCGYIACWRGAPLPLRCPMGTMIEDNFYWSNTYPCGQIDVKSECNDLDRCAVVEMMYILRMNVQTL